jgi:hypothetical protein
MKLLGVAIALGVLACNQDPTNSEGLPDLPGIEARVVVNEMIQFVETNLVPCANGGAGEPVEVTGKLHVVLHETVDAAGGIHQSFHLQDAGSSGVGLVTGTVYRRVGVTRETGSLTSSGTEEFTFINVFDFTAPGPGNNFQLHQVVHVTINQNGVTSEVVKSTVECR